MPTLVCPVCGTALLAANQLTKWRDPVDGFLHGLTVQPLLPGDGDPCEGLVQP